MRAMNPFARAVRAGAVVCGGDDAPVCALDPLAGMQACVEHHESEERLTPQEALALYTVNAARLACAEGDTGTLAVGSAADAVVLDRDPLDGARFDECGVLQTWSDGKRLFER
jgi:predicted amidohydrolase YtcJ